MSGFGKKLGYGDYEPDNIRAELAQKYQGSWQILWRANLSDGDRSEVTMVSVGMRSRQPSKPAIPPQK